MKKAAILADREVKKRRLDVLKVGDIHDEWQSDALKDHANEFANEICPAAFASAGASFNYRVPIGCSAHIGMNWAQTH